MKFVQCTNLHNEICALHNLCIAQISQISVRVQSELVPAVVLLRTAHYRLGMCCSVALPVCFEQTVICLIPEVKYSIVLTASVTLNYKYLIIL